MSEPMFADGVLVIDKPSGPSSHDIVAVMRRTLRRHHPTTDHRPPTRDHRPSTKVGHTGTLDPMASGVLPLVIGKATRLAQFMSGADKEYEADIVLGVATATFDRTGDVVPSAGVRAVSDVTREQVDQALASFRGTYLQAPPVFSAKKIGGDRAYDLARRNEPVRLEPVQVTASVLELIDWQGERLRVRLVCSAGYYVRTLADAIGAQLGTGAHLAALVRTRSGDFTLNDAVDLATLDRQPDVAARRVIPMPRLLPGLRPVTLTPDGAAFASRGGFIGPAHVRSAADLAGLSAGERVRLLYPDGRLLAIAQRRPGGGGLLHPGIVLD